MFYGRSVYSSDNWMNPGDLLDSLKKVEETFVSHWLDQCFRYRHLKRSVYSELVRILRSDHVSINFHNFSTRDLVILAEMNGISLSELYSLGNNRLGGIPQEIRRFLSTKDPSSYQHLDYIPPRVLAEFILETLEKDDLHDLKEIMKFPQWKIDCHLRSKTPIAISARHGSINCFRHLWINNATMDPSIVLEAFRGQNEEIMTMCLEVFPNPDFFGCLSVSLMVHNYNHIKWLITENVKVNKKVFHDVILSGDFVSYFMLDSDFKTKKYSVIGEIGDISISWFLFMASKVPSVLHIQGVGRIAGIAIINGNEQILRFISDHFPYVWKDPDEFTFGHNCTQSMAELMYENGVRDIEPLDSIFSHATGIELFEFLCSKKLTSLEELSQVEINFEDVHPICIPYLLEHGITPSQRAKCEIVMNSKLTDLVNQLWTMMNHGIVFPVPNDRRCFRDYLYLVDKKQRDEKLVQSPSS